MVSSYAARRSLWEHETSVTIYASACIVGIITVSALIAEDARHWCVFPVSLAGLLITRDAVDWIRGRRDLLDPMGLLGLLGFHFFFLAPLLHVVSAHYLPDVEPPKDWRDWIGFMAGLNVVGIAIYQAVAHHIGTAARPQKWLRVIDPRRFHPLLISGLVGAALLQTFIFAKFGGVGGYVEAFESRSGAFKGMGWLFMLSESFPIVAFIGFGVWARRRNATVSWTTLIAVLSIFFVLALIFGGLRGSRSNTVWALFWAVGIIHLSIRPVPRKMVFIGLASLGVFMYVYGFYKAGGLEGVATALQDRSAREELGDRSGLGAKRILLSDFARADVQAYILYRLSEKGDEVDLAFGRTYVAAVSLLIPSRVWPDRPVGKVKEGTEIQYGRGSFRAQHWQSSRIYGLAGEAMLNFGWMSVPIAFAVLGCFVGWIKCLASGLPSIDARWLFYPFLVNLACIVLTSDLDNIVFFTIKNGFVPFLIVMFGSRWLILNEMSGRRPDRPGRALDSRVSRAPRRLPSQKRPTRPRL